MYTLTGGTVSGNGAVVVLTLSAMDLGVLKSRRNLAQSINTTYISITRDFVVDLAGVSVTPVNRLQASVFMDDVTRPELIAFSLNVTANTLSRVFRVCTHRLL